jgi:DNA-binding transcriptional regulator YbjK
MSQLDDLLTLLPDNTAGEISASDLRTIVSALWDYTATVQATLNDVVVTGLPAAQEAINDLDDRVAALEDADGGT